MSNTVKNKDKWLLIFKNSDRRGILALGSNSKKYSWRVETRNLDHPGLYTHIGYVSVVSNETCKTKVKA
jgi:hypothetical protein